MLAAVAVIGLANATPASTQPTRELGPWIGCGRVVIKTAPWKMGIQDTIGVRVIRGRRYSLWVGEAGPSCSFAKQKLAQIARLRTARAVEAASFDGLHCLIRGLSTHIAWVRPIGAWAGCWTSPTSAPTGRYFFWELAIPKRH